MKYFSTWDNSAIRAYRYVRTNNIKLFACKNLKKFHKPSNAEIRHFRNWLKSAPDSNKIILFNDCRQSKNENFSPRFIDKSLGNHFFSLSNSDKTYPQNFLLPSAELLIVLLAKEWSFEKLLLFALEQSGTYSYNIYKNKMVSNCEPILNLKRLKNMCKTLKSSRWAGMNNLEKICKILENGSASPMESFLFSFISAPTKIGGLGINDLKLNYKIPLSDKASRIADQSVIVVDVYHPATRTAIEYDSRLHHSDVDQSQKDKRRREALHKDGFKCISIVPEHVSNFNTFKVCCEILLKTIKGSARIRVKNYNELQFKYYTNLKQELKRLKYC